jgi:hypothetical protein
MFTVINSERIRWTEHVARTREVKVANESVTEVDEG